MEETSAGQDHNDCDKLVLKTSFIFKFLISGSFFTEKEFLNLYRIMLISFPSGEFVDELVDNQKDYQGYNYLYFLRYHTSTVINFVNGEGLY